MTTNDEPTQPDRYTRAMMARLQDRLKPGVTIVQANMRPDGILEAILRMPDGQEHCMGYVELDDDDDDEEEPPA